jgi:hypothetical protein
MIALMFEQPTESTTLELAFCLAPTDSSSAKLPSGRSRAPRTITPPKKWKASGTMYAMRHAVLKSLSTKEAQIKKTNGIVRLVTPPPRLPQPAAVALAPPTMLLANICAHQVWQATKVASEQPMTQRMRMNCHAVLTNTARARATPIE